MKLVACFLVCLAVRLTSTRRLSEIADAIKDLEREMERNIENTISQRTIVAYSADDEDDASVYNNNLKANYSCPTGMTRLNINFTNIQKFKVELDPNANTQTAMYGLDGAKVCNATETAPDCTGYDGMIVLKKNLANETLAFRRNRNKLMSVRQVCIWTFGVLNVTVSIYDSNGVKVVNQKFEPQGNSNWFNYGCSTNDWTSGKRIEIEFDAATPTYNARNVWAEVCK